MIPTELSKPKTAFQDFSTLLYGAPKVGKSTLASQFDHPLFIDTEGGLLSLEVYKTPVGSWEEFKALGAEIREAQQLGKFPFKTLVFDTVDNLKMMCSKYMCEKVLKIAHESDLDYGKGWQTVKKEFAAVLAAYKSLGLGRIYISHADSKEIKTRTGSYTRWSHTMDNQAKDIIEPEVDFIFFCEVITDENGERRVLHTKPCDNWVAGDRTGRLPEEIPMSYEALRAAFDAIMGDKEPEPKASAPAPEPTEKPALPQFTDSASAAAFPGVADAPRTPPRAVPATQRPNTPPMNRNGALPPTRAATQPRNAMPPRNTTTNKEGNQ